MNRNQLIMANLKEEGLVIVDEEGYPADNEVINDEAWFQAMDPANDDFSSCRDNEEAWDRLADYKMNRRELSRQLNKKRFPHRSRGIFNKYDDGGTA